MVVFSDEDGLFSVNKHSYKRESVLNEAIRADYVIDHTTHICSNMIKISSFNSCHPSISPTIILSPSSFRWSFITVSNKLD